MGKGEHLFSAGGSAEWLSHCGNHCTGTLPPKLETVVSHDPATPLQNTSPKDSTLYYRDTCSSVFIAGVFTMVRKWKQPRCSSPGEGILINCHIYTKEYYQDAKKK